MNKDERKQELIKHINNDEVLQIKRVDVST